MGTIGQLKTKAAKRNLRPDGSEKASGFLGRQPVKGGGFASEYSIPLYETGNPGEAGYEKGPNVPTLVPTLTNEERSAMVNDYIPSGRPLPRAIVEKSLLHAKQRMATGQSPFFDPQTERRDPRRARRSFDFR